MTLSIDTRKVTWARVTPMDDEQTLWGIAWEAGIHHGVDRVGDKTTAERIGQDIAGQIFSRIGTYA